MLFQVYDAEEPRAIAVALDSRVPGPRNELWPAYQGQRDAFDPLLVRQLDETAELLGAFGIPAPKVPPHEADDVLATLATLEEAAGGTALVLTSDRDAFQLVSEQVDGAAAGRRRAGAGARRRRGRARALRRAAGPGARPHRPARRPVGQHPRRARHRAEDRGRAAARARRPGGRDRRGGRLQPGPAHRGRWTPPTSCATSCASRRWCATCPSSARRTTCPTGRPAPRSAAAWGMPRLADRLEERATRARLA